jgi:two-component system response regulator HydG
VSHRVLVVDDEPEMCNLLNDRLRRLGYQTTSRTSAIEAFDLLNAEEFDAVVTDVNMRGLNGIDLCRRISLNRPDVPVIVITALGNLETAVAAIRAGAHDFITKPFEIEELNFRLSRALEHRRLRDEVKRLQRGGGAPWSGGGSSEPAR